MARTTSILTTAEIQAVEYLAALDASKAVVTDASGLVISSTATATEVGYLSGVTSAIQTQLNSKPGLSDNNTWTGTNTFSNTVSLDTIQSRTSAGIAVKNSSAADVALFGAGGGTTATFYGGVNVTGTLQVTQLVQLQSTLNYFGSDSSDGSDNKVVFLNGAGGGHSVTRAGYIYVVGNEYASEGGDVTLVAGDSAISGNINMYVYNGGFTQVVKIDRATGSFTLGSSTGVGTRSFYAGAGTFSGAITQTAGQIFTSSSANNFINLDSSGNMLTASRSSINNYIDYDNSSTASALWNLIVDATGTPQTIFSAREDGVFTIQYSNATANVLTITGTTLTTGSSLRVYDNSADTGVRRVIFATNDHASATGCIVAHLQQDSTGDGIYIDKNSSGNSINIDADDNSASAMYGIVMDIANAGAGLEYAFRFNGSEVTSNNIRISNAGTDRLIPTTDSSGNYTITALAKLSSSASTYNSLDLSDSSGNALLSSRGSIFLDIDADNNSTANVLFVRFNAANYTAIFEEDGALTLGTVAKTGSYALYSGAISVMNNGNVTIANTNESTTLTNFTQAITNAGVLINTEYTANAYTAGLFWATSNDNATKPKAGIFMQETGSGTYIVMGTSNAYATGIVNTITVGPDGDIAANRYSAVSTATTQNILASFGDSLTTGRGLYVYSNSGSASSRSLAEIHNDSTAATGTTALLIKQDANYLSQYIIHGGSTIGAFYIGADSLGAGGYCANFVSNSSDASSRWLVGIVNQHASSTGTGLFAMEQNAVTSTNYRKYARYFAGSGTYITFWTADNTTPNGTLSGSAGDICYSTNGNVYRCTSGTSWTAL